MWELIKDICYWANIAGIVSSTLWVIFVIHPKRITGEITTFAECFVAICDYCTIVFIPIMNIIVSLGLFFLFMRGADYYKQKYPDDYDTLYKKWFE